jgi:glucose dehydrogenase
MHTVTLLKRAGIVIALVLLAWIPILNAATDDPSTEGTVNTLLAAIATSNYGALVANAAPALKTRITKETFTQVSTQLSPRLKKGYKLQYLGSLKQQGVEVFLWKITYQDGGDDMLARLVIQENKVAGFWFQ